VFSGITITSNPAGTPIDGQTNTFNYPVLSSVTMTCEVALSTGGILTGFAIYRWDTRRCYTNTEYNSGNPGCFPHSQATQTVTDNDLTAEDAGTISCTATIGGMDYTSDPLVLCISGELHVYTKH